MIKRLFIKNFAIIKETEVMFGNGFNVLTGETGSGKSLIFDAILLSLGEKSNLDMIRKGSDKLVIESEFEFGESSSIWEILKTNEFDKFNNTVLFRREISIKGQSRAFINDTPTNISILNIIREEILDVHLQNGHHSLSNRINHIKIFDESIGIITKSEQYKTKFKEYSDNIKAYYVLLDNSKKSTEEIDYKKFLLSEIDKIAPLEDEDLLIEKELKLLENSEQIISTLDIVINNLRDDEVNAYSLILDSIKKLQVLSIYDNKIGEYIPDIDSASISIKELVNYLSDFKGNLEYNPELIEQHRLRLLELKHLMKKYGSISDALSQKNKLEIAISEFEGFDISKSAIENKLEIEKKELEKLAIELNKDRKENCSLFEKNISNSLNDMGMQGAELKIDIINNLLSDDEFFNSNLNNLKCGLNLNGFDKLEFLIKTNKGEEFKSLSKTASGGEISRLMLAIKSFKNTKSDKVFIFDEIDSGISGNIAKLRRKIKF